MIQEAMMSVIPVLHPCIPADLPSPLATQGNSVQGQRIRTHHSRGPLAVQGVAGSEGILLCNNGLTGELLCLKLIGRHDTRKRDYVVSVAGHQLWFHIQPPMIAHDRVTHCATNATAVRLGSQLYRQCASPHVQGLDGSLLSQFRQ